ncbi:hypothetical protein CDLVIII_0028 [Clostridium sp. DL-VIII]|uniref:KTSC domain-containing protein n=1 Tax=Clostridium sp. DL-VIII TaxID=641107 RepID=UPI00023AF652|nr:KTSC domain-containing protein [Clostridium sp. DL-VIII]EHI96771.1 hypothetical protein CDLVIII_0028 [Clostridium sp. DL-VIII]
MNAEMIYVESTRVEAVGYDEYNSTLYVRFKNGGALYAYYDVPKYEFDDFFTGISIGRKISEIDKVYRYSQV